MNICLSRLLILLTLSFCSALSVAQERSFTLLEREIIYLSEILPGTYDNWQQTNIERAWAMGEPGDFARVRLDVSRQGSADAAGPAFDVEMRNGAEPDASATRIRYVLTADDSAGAIRAVAHNAADDAPMPDCDLLLRRDLFSIAGEKAGPNCSGAPAAMRASDDRIDVMLEEGGEWRRLRKAREFVCMIDVPKNDPLTANHTQHYIDVHDQGGSFDFVHPDGRNMRLLLGQDWSYGMRRDTFFIGVLDLDDNSRTLVYSWAEPGADRIGVNPGWIRVQCDLATEANREMQQRLRPDS